jgi:hypothetical protein
MYRALLKIGLLAPLSQRQSLVVLRMILKYGFRVSIAIVILGFAHAGFRAYQDVRGAGGQPSSIKQRAGACGSNINGNNNQASINCEDKPAGAK